MSQAERRYDRLSVRLSLIISRLLAGETLNMRKLAAEFGVSVRTLHRDFRERLIYLDLEYQDGCCRLLTGGRQEIREEAAMQFARQSGTGALFPDYGPPSGQFIAEQQGLLAMSYLASGGIRNVFPPRHLHTTGQGGIRKQEGNPAG